MEEKDYKRLYEKYREKYERLVAVTRNKIQPDLNHKAKPFRPKLNPKALPFVPIEEEMWEEKEDREQGQKQVIKQLEQQGKRQKELEDQVTQFGERIINPKLQDYQLQEADKRYDDKHRLYKEDLAKDIRENTLRELKDIIILHNIKTCEDLERGRLIDPISKNTIDNNIDILYNYIRKNKHADGFLPNLDQSFEEINKTDMNHEQKVEKKRRLVINACKDRHRQAIIHDYVPNNNYNYNNGELNYDDYEETYHRSIQEHRMAMLGHNIFNLYNRLQKEFDNNTSYHIIMKYLDGDINTKLTLDEYINTIMELIYNGFKGNIARKIVNKNLSLEQIRLLSDIKDIVFDETLHKREWRTLNNILDYYHRYNDKPWMRTNNRLITAEIKDLLTQLFT